jgi:tetraacyldisaccharide 4'-kinase
MFLLRVILFPFAILYDLITRLRNRLYDLQIKPSVAFEVPTVVVGNLTVGGTGKTPMVEYLIRTFSQRYQLVILSRGYGRKTRGMRVANALDDATTIGDEPLQLYKKFHEDVVVAVGEDRVFGITHLLDQFPDTEAVLMDDAFQHRPVRGKMNILLTDYQRPFYQDYLLPAGRLRESKIGAKRADVVVVTKCPPNISDDVMMNMEVAIREFADRPVFFTRIRYGNPLPFGLNTSSLQEKVVLVTGIAHSKTLKDYIADRFNLIRHYEFSDHHTYTSADLAKITSDIETTVSIITTEKDMVKLDSDEFRSVVSGFPFFYMPIAMEFIKNGEDFDALVEAVLP